MSGAAAKTLSPVERLNLVAGRLAMRLSEPGLPADMFAEIRACAARLDATLCDDHAVIVIREQLLHVAAITLITPRYQDDIHAREAFIAAARLCAGMEGGA